MTTSDPGTRLADEFRLLVGMVAERAGPWLDRLVATEHADHPDDGPDDGRPSNCAYCPLCALISVVRGEPTEMGALAMERAADLVALLRAVLADRWDPAAPPHMPGFRPAEPEPPAPESQVERIPVRRKTSMERGG